jgi:ferredoxin
MGRKHMTTAETDQLLTIVLDRSKCCGYTLCAAEAPEVYSIDDQGFAVIADNVSIALEEQARRGADACPAGALTVTLPDA